MRQGSIIERRANLRVDREEIKTRKQVKDERERQKQREEAKLKEEERERLESIARKQLSKRFSKFSGGKKLTAGVLASIYRSEEHTSEPQSQSSV